MFNYLPVVTLTGPRQSGKTTLCRRIFGELPYVNLEDQSTLSEFEYDVCLMIRVQLLPKEISTLKRLLSKGGALYAENLYKDRIYRRQCRCC